MSRAEYSCGIDEWALIRWRGAVAAAVRGARGQAFLRELRDALDSMEVKELVADELQCEDGVCALGRVAQVRGIDWTGIDPYGNNETIAAQMGIAHALVCEIEHVNDDGRRVYFSSRDERVERRDRWHDVRAWVEKQIVE